MNYEERVNELRKQSNEFWEKNEDGKAIDLLKEVIGIYESNNDLEGAINILKRVGYYYDHLGNFENALECYEKNLKYSELTNNTDQEAHSLHNIGGINLKQGNFDTALDFFQKSLNLRKILKVETPIAYSLQNIGRVYFQKNDYKNALLYYEKSLKIREKLVTELNSKEWDKKNSIYPFRDLSQSYFELSIYYFEIGNREVANKYFNKLKNLELKTKDMLEENLVNIEIPDINLYKNLLQALILKTEERFENKFKSVSIFREISENTTIRQRFQVFALKNLLEVFLVEFKAINSPKVFNEILSTTNKLMEIAIQQKSNSLKSEVLILQAKLALIEGKINIANEKLQVAESLIESKKLSYLFSQVETEKERISLELNRWKTLSLENVDFIKKIEDTEIDEYLQKIQKLKSGFSDFR